MKYITLCAISLALLLNGCERQAKAKAPGITTNWTALASVGNAAMPTGNTVVVQIVPDGTFFLSDIVFIRQSGGGLAKGAHLDSAAMGAKLKDLHERHPNLKVGIAVAQGTDPRLVTAARTAAQTAGFTNVQMFPIVP